LGPEEFFDKYVHSVLFFEATMEALALSSMRHPHKTFRCGMSIWKEAYLDPFGMDFSEMWMFFFVMPPSKGPPWFM